MKKLSRLLSLALAIICIFTTLTACEKGPMREIEKPSNGHARAGLCAWDLFLYENKIYVGGGDYGDNRGPVVVYAYNLKTKKMENTGTLGDEEVNRFLNIDGKLVCPGIDPQGSGVGQYFVKDGTDGEWETKPSLPGVIHTFDMVSFNGELFAGNGVSPAEFPISRSKDGGQTFEQVQMIKNGEPILTTGVQIRVYDFFVFNDNLYAMYTSHDGNSRTIMDIYKYQDGVFVFDYEWLSKVSTITVCHVMLNGKVVFKDKLFVNLGNLYWTSNMDDVYRIRFKYNPTVQDILVDDDTLYAMTCLTTEKEDGSKTYTIAVHSNTTGKGADFKELFSFETTAPALSFLKVENTFYFGMGEMGKNNPMNGNLIEYEYTEN